MLSELKLIRIFKKMYMKYEHNRHHVAGVLHQTEYLQSTTVVTLFHITVTVCGGHLTLQP